MWRLQCRSRREDTLSPDSAEHEPLLYMRARLSAGDSREVAEEEAQPYSTIASGILVEAFPHKSVAYAASLFVVETSARSLRKGLSGETPSKSA